MSRSRRFANLVVVFVGLSPLLSPFGAAQTDSPLEGTVATASGQPVAGATVYGSRLAKCCPFKSESTRTDERGAFHLDHPGTVVHFVKDDFEPQALVVQPGTSQVQITLSTLGNDFTAPSCGAPRPGTRRIGWTLSFDVPKGDVRVLGGKTDVDYTRYVIKPKKGNSYMEFWLGPYALNTEPDDETFVNSIEFFQRRVLAQNFGAVGIDSWGQLRSHEKWRQTVVAGEGGARYKATQPQDAALFDDIVNSLCIVSPEKASARKVAAQPKP